MAKKHMMLIDARRCIDCKACMLACKTTHALPHKHWRNWIHADVQHAAPESAESPYAASKPTAVFQPGACLHCSQPSCVDSCPTGATFRDLCTGEVRIDATVCIGCGACLPACPYNARQIRKDLGVADKCDFCADRRAQGLNPACVDTCPTGVRLFGDAAEPGSPVAAALASGNWVALEPPDTSTQPNLLYAESAKPDDWLRPVQETEPAAALTTLFAPFVRVAVGLTGVGVAAAIARQCLLPDPPEHTDTVTDDKKGEPHA